MIDYLVDMYFPSVESLRTGSQCAGLELVVGAVVCVCGWVELRREMYCLGISANRVL